MEKPLPQKLGLKHVQELIPHRAPILLVDHITGWEADRWIETSRTLKEGDPLFRGHFPGNPILPGMLTFEAIAQSAALLVSLSRGLTHKNASYIFGGVENGKLTSLVRPGETLRMRAEKQKEKLNIFRFDGKAWVGERQVAELSLTAKLIVEQERD